MHTKTKTSQKMLKAYENKIIPFHRFIIQQLEGNNFEMKQQIQTKRNNLMFSEIGLYLKKMKKVLW